MFYFTQLCSNEYKGANQTNRYRVESQEHYLIMIQLRRLLGTLISKETKEFQHRHRIIMNECNAERGYIHTVGTLNTVFIIKCQYAPLFRYLLHYIRA